MALFLIGYHRNSVFGSWPIHGELRVGVRAGDNGIDLGCACAVSIHATVEELGQRCFLVPASGATRPLLNRWPVQTRAALQVGDLLQFSCNPAHLLFVRDDLHDMSPKPVIITDALQPWSCRVVYGGTELTLTNQERLILRVLVDTRGRRIVTKAELGNRIMELRERAGRDIGRTGLGAHHTREHEEDGGEGWTEGSLNKALSQLRAKLKATGLTEQVVVSAGKQGVYLATDRVVVEHGHEEGFRWLSSLPTWNTSLIGREQELAQAEAALLHQRALVIYGPAGSGKTRLAVELGRRVSDGFPAGVWYWQIDEQHLSIGHALAHTLGIKLPQNGGKVHLAALAGALETKLGDNPSLLLVDIPPGLSSDLTRQIAELVSRFLNRASLAALKFMIICREVPDWLPLGTQVLLTPPLSLPPSPAADFGTSPLDAVWSSNAVRLLVDRAESLALTPENASSVAALVKALDGLPGPIELAAQQLPFAASVAQVVNGMERVTASLPSAQAWDERHPLAPLRSSLAWTYLNLDETARRIVRRLSVFSGGFSFEAAYAVVVDKHIAGKDLLNSLNELGRRALISVEPYAEDGRYRILSNVCAFAAEELQRDPDKAMVQQYFRGYFVQLAQQAVPHFWGSPQKEVWRSRLLADQANLRSTFQSAEQAGDWKAYRTLCVSLYRFWIEQGWLSEGLERLRTALAATPDAGNMRFALLTAAAALAIRTAAYTEASAWLEEAQNGYDDTGLTDGRAQAAYQRALLAWYRNEPDREAQARQAVTAAAVESERFLEAAGRNTLGLILQWQGRYDEARREFEHALGIHRLLGDAYSCAVVSNNLGLVAFEQGQFESADDHFDVAGRLWNQLKASVEIAGTLLNAARVNQQKAVLADEPVVARPELQTATERLIKALDNFREAGVPLGEAKCLANLGIVSGLMHERSSAQTWFTQAMRRYEQLEDPQGIIATIEDIACCGLLRSPQIICLLAFAESVRQERGLPRGRQQQERCRSAMESAALDAGEGQVVLAHLTLEQASALAAAWL